MRGKRVAPISAAWEHHHLLKHVPCTRAPRARARARGPTQLSFRRGGPVVPKAPPNCSQLFPIAQYRGQLAGDDRTIRCKNTVKFAMACNSIQKIFPTVPNCSELFPMVPNFRIPDLEMFPIVPKPRVVPMFPTRKNCSHVPKVFPSSAMFPCSLFPIGTQSMLVPIGKRHVPIGKQNHCSPWAVYSRN